MGGHRDTSTCLRGGGFNRHLWGFDSVRFAVLLHHRTTRCLLAGFAIEFYSQRTTRNRIHFFENAFSQRHLLEWKVHTHSTYRKAPRIDTALSCRNNTDWHTLSHAQQVCVDKKANMGESSKITYSLSHARAVCLVLT